MSIANPQVMTRPATANPATANPATANPGTANPGTANPVSVLVVAKATDRSQMTLLRALELRFRGRLAFTVAGSEDQAPGRFDFPWVSRTSPAYSRHVHHAPIVLLLDRRSRFTRFNLRQFCVAVAGDKTYTAHGLQIRHMAPAALIDQGRDWSDQAFGFVFGTALRDTRHIPPARIRFVEGTQYLDTLEAVSACLEGLLPRLPAPRPTVYLLAESLDTARRLPAPLLAHLQRAVAADEINLVLSSRAAVQDFAHLGLPFTQMVPQDVFTFAFNAADLKEDDLVLYSSFAFLTKNGLQSHRPVYLYAENLDLLRFRPDVTTALLHDLAKDPYAFHQDSLKAHYAARDGAAQTLSIIIPHYNTEIDKLTRCLRSALACRTHHARTEILLIDDGSKEDVGPALQAALKDAWSTIRYLRKPNEGPGLTRNHGIRHATGDYIFLLDADDEIVSENLWAMLAHALATDAGLVIGKRIMCDAQGNFERDSMNHIFRGVARSVGNRTISLYDEQMVTNKLIRRQDFIDGALWFPAGFYEDNLGSVLAYNHFRHAECLNVPIHRWYQYDDGGSITKSVSPRHIQDKLTSMEDSWLHLAEAPRRARIKFNLNYDLPHFLSMAERLPPAQSAPILTRMRDYVLTRRGYVHEEGLLPEGASLLRHLQGEAPASHPLPAALAKAPDAKAPDAKAPGTARHVFFPRTHFQVLEAIAFVLEEQVPGLLVIAENIPGFEPAFVKNLQRTGIFEQIITYGNAAVYDALERKLALGSGSAPLIFDTLFRNFDAALPGLRASDVGVFFLEGWPERYFIGRKFHKLIKLEDGYCSTSREFTLDFKDGIWGVNRLKHGIWGRISVFAQAHYDSLHPQRKAISEIHVSTAVEPGLMTGDYATARIVTRDFKAVMQRHRARFVKALDVLYGKHRDLEPDATIILTQPLFFDYCDMKDHIAVVAHLIRLAEPGKIYIKPHPMDPCDYGVLGLPVLPARVPFEYFEAKGNRVKQAITFGSSALENSLVVEQVRYLFPRDGFTSDEVKAAIRQICHGEGALGLPATEALFKGWSAGQRSQGAAGAARRQPLRTALRLLHQNPKGLVKALRRRLRRKSR